MIKSTAAREDLGADPALRDALRLVAARGRLSDEEARALRRRRRDRKTAAGLAALACLLVVAALHPTAGRLRDAAPLQTFATEPGRTRSVRLSDGSRLELSGGSRVEVALRGDGRAARLAAGEAYFDVAHDVARPFTVEAGGAQVRVLGTAFDLGVSGGDTRLTVYRGAVSFGRGRDAVVVPAGYRTRLHAGRTERPARFDAARLDWRSGWIDVDTMRLGELADVLARQTGAVIAPPSPALAAVQVTGRFRLDDPRRLLAAVGEVDGFTVRERGGALVLTAAR